MRSLMTIRIARITRSTGAALAIGALTWLASPRPVRACGGTFCDTGPRAMPVDQTGENIVYVMKPGQVEAHIQIQYRGDAARFSWVLPVQALPEIEVGSQALFDRLLNATVPRFGFTTQRDFCGGTTGGGGGAGGSGFPSSGAADAGSDSSGGVVVVAQKQVGAFETTVLSGGTGAEVVNWLTTNGYQTPPEAPALIQDYVARGFLFIAVKLTGGAGIDEIHPLVVRYTGTEPCVPIKLTAVAAVEDMGIRTFFLGTRRVVPKNFKHMVLNPVRLNWLGLGSNYKELVSRAADSFVADGKAFVTEYAGPTAIVGANPIAPPSWNATAFTSVPVVDVVTRLTEQGFLACFGSGCTYRHPLLLPLLREFVPPPASLVAGGGDAGPVITDPKQVEGYFYSCLSCYRDQIDLTKWNAGQFASTLAARIIDPARHADALLANWPYLTRMFTTLSPVEMTKDPDFMERDGLPGVTLTTNNALRRITCTGASGMTLPDGRMVALTPLSTWRINSLLKAWNDSQNWPPPSGPGGSGGAGGQTGGSGGSFGIDAGLGTDSGSAGPGTTGGSIGSGTTGSGGAMGSGRDGSAGNAGNGGNGQSGGAPGADGGLDARGCACELATRPAGRPSFALAALLGVAAARRRKR
jgi:hypothetical protein